MGTKFFTNEGQNTLLQKFKGVFENNKDIEFFDALIGYFRASGYFRIRQFLHDVPQIRILIGINVDKIIEKYHSKGLLFQGDANQTLIEFLNEAKEDIQQSDYNREVEEGILQFIKDIASKKILIKAHPSKKLHAKIYIFRPDKWNEHRSGSVITGSSNLTDAGLGAGDNFNYEFNVVLNDYDDVKFASDEFEKLWLEGIAILPVEIERVKQETYLNENFTPFEVYIKFLIEYFGKSVEFDPNSVSDLPKGFKRLSYQIDAVNEGFKLLQKHNGFFLADVVGLGKTIVGTLIAKKFFYSNDFPSHVSNILIVVPPAIKENWIETLEKFQLHNYTIITNGSLHKISDPEKYDLILIDEAHKFRNDTAEAYNELQKLCKTKTKRILKDGSKAEKKVILISATPLNNRPEDIANQVYLFQDAKDSTLEISNLQHFFRKRIDEYKKLKDNPSISEVQEGVKKIYQEIRDKVIAPLTVRRTRSDLKAHEQYTSDLGSQGIVFPDIEKPRKIFYQLGESLDDLYDKTMYLLSHEIDGVKYYRYQAIKFLLASKKSKYKNADVASAALAKIMKTLLVKRIDSSFFAFKASLNRFAEATGAMIKMFEAGTVFIAPNLNVTEYIVEEREDELMQRILDLKETDPTIEICTPDDFQQEFFEGLKRDYAILVDLNNRWKNVTEDPKLDEFVNRINNELLNKEINPQSKLVVFSESRETTNYLVEHLKGLGRTDVLEVHAGNRNNLREIVRNNFDANIPREAYRSDYNIVISTEVLAEGVNLHRANVIVNYDTPWNSTKLMQRIGRVNRIGSVAPKVYIYNFYPTSKVNDDIELEKKAIMKLQAFHSALGEDSEIYSPDEETQSFGLFDKNVEEEKDEKLAFLMELRKFKEENPELFRRIKNMPLRARVGRKERTKRDTTICFIRNNRRDAFYWMRSDGSLEEMTFVEVAREFRADTPEKGIELHEEHHNHVNKALLDFHTKLQEEMASGQVVDTTQGPNEKRALSYLDGFLSLPFIGEVEKDKIKAAKQAIKLGRFQKLQRDVNALKKNVKKTPMKAVDLLDSIIKIIDKYPIEHGDNGDSRPTVTIKSFEKFKPEIIISESFSFTK
jgi:superfamily II DNA/RNA helicase/HKD family nuclease